MLCKNKLKLFIITKACKCLIIRFLPYANTGVYIVDIFYFLVNNINACKDFRKILSIGILIIVSF